MSTVRAGTPGASADEVTGGDNLRLGLVLGLASALRPLDAPGAGRRGTSATPVIHRAACPGMARGRRGTQSEGMVITVASLGVTALALRR